MPFDYKWRASRIWYISFYDRFWPCKSVLTVGDFFLHLKIFRRLHPLFYPHCLNLHVDELLLYIQAWTGVQKVLCLNIQSPNRWLEKNLSFLQFCTTIPPSTSSSHVWALLKTVKFSYVLMLDTSKYHLVFSLCPPIIKQLFFTKWLCLCNFFLEMLMHCSM